MSLTPPRIKAEIQRPLYLDRQTVLWRGAVGTACVHMRACVRKTHTHVLLLMCVCVYVNALSEQSCPTLSVCV